MQTPLRDVENPLSSWHRPGTGLLILILLSALVLLVFRNLPGLDFWTSNLFFDELPCDTNVGNTRCGVFPAANADWWIVVREIGHALPRLLMLAVFIHLVWLLMFNRNKSPARLYPPVFAAISGILGPLIVVNLILKEYWGRPRPFTTDWFGGTLPFVPAGDISTYCQSNCSFVSGEASAAFWMLALVFYFAPKHRPAFLTIATLVALGIGLLRIAFGRHFLSDVVMAALITFTLITLTAWLLQQSRVVVWITKFNDFSNRHAFRLGGSQ